MTPDRIALQPLAGQRVYFEAQVIRGYAGRTNVRFIQNRPHLCMKPVEINGRSLRQMPDTSEAMHLWIALPPTVIQKNEQCAQTLSIRGFATVMLYARGDGSLAFGLNHAQDLELQCGANESWNVLAGPVPFSAAVNVNRSAVIPDEVASGQYLGWITYFSPKVVHVHRKIVTYGQRNADPHYRSYCLILNASHGAVRAGQLPAATEMNTVYYLMGQWRAGQAPRHLREAYP